MANAMTRNDLESQFSRRDIDLADALNSRIAQEQRALTAQEIADTVGEFLGDVHRVQGSGLIRVLVNGDYPHEWHNARTDLINILLFPEKLPRPQQAVASESVQ